jgi:hypothetical protein
MLRWPWGFLKAGSLVVLAFVACTVVPETKEALLSQVIIEASQGRARADAYAVISPSDPERTEAFQYLESWLDINREAVEGVKAYTVEQEGTFRFTQSRDGKKIYLISEGWPGSQVRTKILQAKPGMVVTLLGWPDVLPWEQVGSTLVITTPKELADEANHPCKQAFVFRFQLAP